MRDIRTDLRERLASVAERLTYAMIKYNKCRDLEQTKQMIEVLESEQVILEQLLAIEEGRNKRRLDHFLVGRVHASGPMHKEELRNAAQEAGYFEEANGRTFHATLMNITNGGRLILQADGRYALPTKSGGNADRNGPIERGGRNENANVKEAQAISRPSPASASAQACEIIGNWRAKPDNAAGDCELGTRADSEHMEP